MRRILKERTNGKMKRYEYKILSLDFHDLPKGNNKMESGRRRQERALNDYDYRGWELCALSSGYMVFKREVNP